MIPDDANARERIRTEFSRNLVIEAGAGTGKTTSILERVVQGIGSGRFAIGELVLITFTETAAAELSTRLRDRLVVALGESSPDWRARIEAALSGIGDASIMTIHAFALEVLTSYGARAGIPPLRVMGSIDAYRARAQFFENWNETALSDPELRGLLSLGHTLGITRRTLTSFSEAILEDGGESDPGQVRSLSAIASRLAAARIALTAHLASLDGELRGDVPDGPLLHAVRALRSLSGISGTAPDDAARWLITCHGAATGKWGSKKEWKAAGRDPEEFTRVKDLVTSANTISKDAIVEAGSAVLTALVVSLVKASGLEASRRKARGAAMFHDLLAWTRDLLTDDAIRAEAHERWTCIIIDEFQDTDPVQVEIALLLAGNPGPKGIELIPGRLVVVGDPKQSIFRFRNADVALFASVAESILASGGERCVLSTNFRSVPAILSVVNAHFEERMTDDGSHIQADYHRLSPGRSEGGGVSCLGGASEDAAGIVVAREMREIAMIAADLHGKGRAWGDIGVLIPGSTQLRTLQREFDRGRIPYAVASGDLLLETQEIRDIMAVLAAVASPGDADSVVAALASDAFSLGDEELMAHALDGHPWNYLESTDTSTGVGKAFSVLRELHERSGELGIYEIVEEIMEGRYLPHGAFFRRFPLEQLRRYDWLSRMAFQYGTDARYPSLSDFVAWLRSLLSHARGDALPIISDDPAAAVRVLTVHSAKGLEFPVTIVASAVSIGGKSTDKKSYYRDVAAHTFSAHVKGLGAFSYDTPAYDAMAGAESERAKAEQRRLLYVALTRARDELIVSAHAAKGTKSRVLYHDVRELRESVEQCEILMTAAVHGEADAPAFEIRQPEEALVDEATEDRIAEEAWEKEAAAFRASLPVRETVAPTRYVERAPSPAPGGGGTAAAFGTAVHEALSRIDIADPSRDAATIEAVTGGLGIDASRIATIVSYVREQYAAAFASRRLWREAPVAAEFPDVRLAGFIDLLFEEEGRLVLVDYKTGRFPGEDSVKVEGYRSQLSLYAASIERLHPGTVARGELCFVEDRIVVPVGLSELVSTAEEILRPLPS